MSKMLLVLILAIFPISTVAKDFASPVASLVIHAPKPIVTNTIGNLNFTIQVPQEQNDLVTLEKMAAELKKLRVTNQLLQEQISALTNAIETYKKVDIVRLEQLDALSNAIEARKQLDELQLKKEELLKMEIDLYKTRVGMLEADLKSAKRSRIKTQILSTLISVSLAYFAIK